LTDLVPRPKRRHSVLEDSAQEKRNELEASVRDSSEKLRQFLFAYLALITYVVAAVFSTTDRQLLLANQGLKLPVVDLTVPLLGFYLAVPFFVLALHFNLLQNLAQHHRKLICWRESWNGEVPPEKVTAFIFDAATLSQTGTFARWTRAVSAGVCFYSGPAVLSIILWRFADYQSRLALLTHAGALWLDVVFVAKARNLFYEHQHQRTSAVASESQSRLEYVIAPVLAAPRSRFASIWYTFVVAMLIKIAICVDVYVIPWQNSILRKLGGPLLFKVEDGDEFRANLYGFLPRIAIDRTDTLFKPAISEMKAQGELANIDWRVQFETRGMSLDLRNRSLKYLSIPAQYIPRLWARGAELQGADLSFAVLTGATLPDADLAGASLGFADIEGGWLVDTNLRGANLLNARLAGMYAERVEAQGADLAGANLEGALLIDVGLEGAELEHATLDGALLSRVRSWGAVPPSEPIVVLSPLGSSPTIDATEPTPVQVNEWADEQASRELGRLYADRMLRGRTTPNQFPQLIPDDKRSVRALLAAVCGNDQRATIKLSALRTLNSMLLLAGHPAQAELAAQSKAVHCGIDLKLALTPIPR
jgi:hypothetical protein